MTQFVTFGGMAGWLHPGRSGLGVVLCSAFADEELSAHQGWRDLAGMLSARGLPTLRFDLPGTGDSAGTLPEAELMEAWLDGVADAAGFLRRHAGVTSVALVGLRLGALVAGLAAERLGGVAALVLLAPPSGGRAHLRELRLMQRAATLAPVEAKPWLDLDGHRLSPAVLREIEATALPAHLAAPRVLLAEGRPGACMQDATQIAFEGYEAFMQDNLHARVPKALFRQVSDWLAQPAWPDAAPPHPTPPAALRLHGMTETPAWFGPGGSLFGILCIPDRVQNGAPAVVLLSSGATHQVGNGRLCVLLARHLAALGVVTLRMASPGAGENRGQPSPAGVAPYARGLGVGVGAAVDLLGTLGHRRFAAFGLCSGGYVAFHAARADPRLSALVLLNLQTFDWREGDSLVMPVRAQATYLQSLRSGEALRRLLRRGEDRLTLRRGLRVVAILLWRRLRVVRDGLRRQRPGARAVPRTVLGWFRALGGRGCRVLVMWGDADPGLDAARAAFGPGLRRLGRVPGVTAMVLPDTTHIPGPAAQEAFLAAAAAFLADSPRSARESCQPARTGSIGEGGTPPASIASPASSSRSSR